MDGGIITKSVAEQRAAFLAEAETWIGTPYHDLAELKGVGADCRGSLYGIAFNSGLVPKTKFPRYSPRQNLHKAKETYLEGLLQFCVEVPPPPEREPIGGDLVVWKFGLVFWHTAIIERWPVVLHSYVISGRFDREDVSKSDHFQIIGENVPERGQPRPKKFLVFREWLENEPLYHPIDDDARKDAAHSLKTV